MLLGTASWVEGPVERRALVARLGSGRLADLNRIEALRLRKLGEGEPDRLADARVPSSLRRVLEGGPRALARVRQAAAYAEKWDQRGTLPTSLAPVASPALTMLPCLPRPASLRHLGGALLDRFNLQRQGAEWEHLPQPSLAALGLSGGGPAGFCLALHGAGATLLGAWLVDGWPTADLEFRAGTHRRSLSSQAWDGLELPPLRAGEVLLLPPPKFRAFGELPAGASLHFGSDFDRLEGRLGPEGLHPTVQ